MSNNVAFVSALRQGDVEAVRLMLSRGDAHANMMVAIAMEDLHPNDEGDGSVSVPALHAATVFGRADVVELLLEKNAQVNATAETIGVAPLVLALERSFFHVADVLLREGADANALNRSFRNPLESYCCYSSTGALYIPTLLRYGGNIEGSGHSSRTPLHFVCEWGTLQLASIFVEHGANVNACNHLGRSPIFLSNTPDIMRVLITNGAQVNLQDNDGWTPLHWWAKTNDMSCCKLLLSNNANIEATARDDQTPLHVAVRHGSFEAACLILAHQRSRHGHDSVGRLSLKTTPIPYKQNVLHDARSARMARLLVEQCHGEDGILLPACHQLMFARDYFGDTPLKEARRRARPEVVQYLESFTMRTLATCAASSDDDDDDAVAVMLNPSLDGFQSAIATESLDTLRTSTCSLDVTDAALYIVLGYLSVSDTMKR